MTFLYIILFKINCKILKMFNLNIMYQEKIIKKESLLKLMISMLLKYLEMIKNKPTLKNPE